MEVVLCCLDGENLVGSHKNELQTKQQMPIVSPRVVGYFYSLLFVVVGVHGVFHVGDPCKRFPDNASSRFQPSCLEHHSEVTGFCLQRQPMCQNRERKIENLTPAIKVLPCESFFEAAGLGRDA